MGTRSTTRIYRIYKDENGKEHRELLLALYKQYDGNTDCWGKELKKFIKSGQFVNGINDGKLNGKKFMFNGAGCFALQLVKEFKDGAGGLYATSEGDRQGYNYVIEIIQPVDVDEVKRKVVNRLVNQNPQSYAKIKISCEEEPDFDEEYVTEVL